jgi:polysaccharide biosynthesis transport protein
MNVRRQCSSFTPPIDGDPSSGLRPWLEVRRFILRQGRLIGSVTALVFILGVAQLAITPSRYTARTDMIIDTKRMVWVESQVATESRKMVRMRPELATESRVIDDAAVESEIETTLSEKVAIRVARRLRLDDDQEFVDTANDVISRIFSLLKITSAPEPQATREEIMRRVLATLKRNLRVTRLGHSYIEQIAYTSLDREKAARIANAFADAYIEYQLEANVEATHRANTWLEARTDELRKQASDAYEAVQEFKSQNGIIMGTVSRPARTRARNETQIQRPPEDADGSDGKLASEVELDELGKALAKARADTSQARAKLERIELVLERRSNKTDFNVPDPIVTDGLNNPVITKLRQQFLDDQSKESEWSARYGIDHQAAGNLRSEMAALQHAIWDEIARIAESYKSELQIAKAREESIDRRMVEVFQGSAATRQKQVKLRELETTAKSYRITYETFLSRFAQSVQQQSFPSTQARVLTAATPPFARSSPKSRSTLMWAALCGLGLGIVAAYAREQIGTPIHTPAQLESLLGARCLAILPNVTKKRSALRKELGKVQPVSFRYISEVAPFSATAEALRCIKLAIDLHPAGHQVVGIVSALPGEGKTTVAAAFATFVAKAGARTLLIDADLRKPSMTTMLGYKSASGLLEIAVDKSDFDRLVIADCRYKFDFLPSFSRIRPSNSSDILNSPAIKQMLKAAKDEYDYVLVDLPPILPVVDVKAAAHLFDAFVLVVEWGSTSTDEVLKAVGTSPLLSERLLGAVLNKADGAVMRRFEGYSDRSYQFYTHEKTSSEVA